MRTNSTPRALSSRTSSSVRSDMYAAPMVLDGSATHSRSWPDSWYRMRPPWHTSASSPSCHA